LLLDGDCKHPGSSGYLTVDSLTTLGCDSDFLTKQVVYIGTKEYEDAFDDQTVCNALNGTFPRDDGTPWDVAAIAAVRATSPKFSEDVRQNVIHQCVRGLRTQVRKPTIAEALAVSSITLGTIPTALIDLFNVARVRAGLVN